MPRTFFTSDLHISHARIIELSNRPFRDVDHMNWSLVANWNSLVDADDVVWILGDLALGQIADSMGIVEKFNGHKNLVPGNHDRVWQGFYDKGVRPEHEELYKQAGLTIWSSSVVYRTGWTLCHFPDVGDSHDEDRFAQYRPATPKRGQVLIHGHTHSVTDRVTRTEHGGYRVHVGVDAWHYAPVSEDIIKDLIADQEENWREK